MLFDLHFVRHVLTKIYLKIADPCENGGRCEDGVNQFICQCPPGYGGKRCEKEIDECDSSESKYIKNSQIFIY